MRPQDWSWLHWTCALHSSKRTMQSRQTLYQLIGKDQVGSPSLCPLPSIFPLGENTQACNDYLTAERSARTGGEEEQSVQFSEDRNRRQLRRPCICPAITAVSLGFGVEAAAQTEWWMISRQRNTQQTSGKIMALVAQSCSTPFKVLMEGTDVD